MRKICVFLAALISLSISYGHPGIGIVCDSKGNIFYTDLKQVWKLAPGGNKSVAVPDVHTHELFLDNNDNLFGEHNWYNGERLNTWGHYVWRLQPDGTLDTVIPSTAGFLDNYSFTRDSSGNMYWVQRFKTSRFKKRSPDGKINVIAERRFKDVRWVYVTTAGIIYFVDLLDLYKLDQNGKFTLLAKNLATSQNPPDDNRHSVYGIWTDRADNVYVAVLANRHIKKISPAGKVKIVYNSGGGWFPTGGVFDRHGNLWVLEANSVNNVRVQKITKETIEHFPAVQSQFPGKLIIQLLIIGIVVVITVTAFIKLSGRFQRFSAVSGAG